MDKLREEKAIKQLERALECCALLDIEIYGMDDCLYYITMNARKRAEKEEVYYIAKDSLGGAVPKTLQYIKKGKPGSDLIEDYGAYIDSGGW
jgi:hypothetical protein